MPVGTERFVVRSQPDHRAIDAPSRLRRLYTVLAEDGNDLDVCQLGPILDLLDRLIAAESSVKEKLSPSIGQLIGDLSILGECLRQFANYHPWASSFDRASEELEEEITKSFRTSSHLSSGVYLVFLRTANRGLADYADPSGGKWEYPVHEKRDKQNVDKLRQAEASLDSFWAGVDEQMFDMMGWMKATAFSRLLCTPHALQRTPEWVEPAKGKGAARESTKDEHVRLLTPMSDVFFKRRLNEDCFDEDAYLAAAELEVSAPTQNKHKGPAPAKPFVLDARAYKTFRILLYDPTSTHTPRDVPWQDFLHAMTAVGFGGLKLYGTAWHFWRKADWQQSIQFQSPLPATKLPFQTARIYGKRLRRRFGWTATMFELAETRKAKKRSK